MTKQSDVASLAFDDPVVWIIIVGAVVLLFGSAKIPDFARGLGKARKEYDLASKGLSPDRSNEKN